MSSRSVFVCPAGHSDGDNKIQGITPPHTDCQTPNELTAHTGGSCVQVHLYSEPDFRGRRVSLEDSVAALDEEFLPRSCKVLAGRYDTFRDH